MSRERVFGTLCGFVLMVNLARLVFAPLVDELLRVFGISTATAGLLVTMVWIGSALPRIPTGWLLTKVPRHHVVLGAGVLLTLAAWFAAGVDAIAASTGLPPVPLLAAAGLLLGSTSGAYFVSATPLVSELFPDRIGRAIGIHGSASQLAAVLAAPFVLFVLATFSTWRVAFVLIGIGGLVVTLLLLWSTRQATLPEAGEADHDLAAAARSEWRLILLGVSIIGLTGFVWQGVFNFYELYMESKGLVDATAKNMLTVVFAAGLPAFLLSGRLADRFPHVPYVLGIVATFALLLLVLTVVQGLLALVVATAALGFAIHSLFPAMDTFLLDTLPDENRGSAYALYSGTMMFMQAGGSTAVGTLRATGLGYNTIFSTAALLLCSLVALLAILKWRGWLPA